MIGIDPSKVSEKYNSVQTVWDVNDRWHSVTHNMIKSFIDAHVNSIEPHFKARILNAGSAGYSYGLEEAGMAHLDLAEKKISSLSNAAHGNIQTAPFKSSMFGLIICVGSVINYCDPVIVFEEFERLLLPDGYLILEFESSRTLELLGQTGFNNSVILTDTFYNGTKERLWYFSESFVQRLAAEFGFKICARDTCHVLSPLIYRAFRNESFSSYFSCLDGLMHHIPGMKLLASNVIFFLRGKP